MFCESSQRFIINSSAPFVLQKRLVKLKLKRLELKMTKSQNNSFEFLSF